LLLHTETPSPVACHFDEHTRTGYEEAEKRRREEEEEQRRAEAEKERREREVLVYSQMS
jgi:hypothetical protein